jgi:hypothetical protein
MPRGGAFSTWPLGGRKGLVMRESRSVSASLLTSSAASSKDEPKPISAKKVAANRENARRSTGPRTVEGKGRSSRNAVTHGLTSQASILPGEDPAELHELAEEMEQGLRPRGGGQRRLVERIVSLTWRLRRIATAEETMYFVDERDRAIGSARARKLREVQAAARAQLKQEQAEKPGETVRGGLLGDGMADVLAGLDEAAREEVGGDNPDAAPDGAAFVARQFLYKRDNNAIERLAVYEQRLDRQLHAAYRQLIALRKMQQADDGDRDEGEIRTDRESLSRQNEPTADAAVSVSGHEEVDCASRTPGALAPSGDADGADNRPAFERPAHHDPGGASTPGVREERVAMQGPDLDVRQHSGKNEPNVSDGAMVSVLDRSATSDKPHSKPAPKRVRRV